jgi:hypothetical protein
LAIQLNDWVNNYSSQKKEEIEKLNALFIFRRKKILDKDFSLKQRLLSHLRLERKRTFEGTKLGISSNDLILAFYNLSL